ncbi:MAG: hypothetical protein FD155_2366 [Bacteroidetes bacterium]|nr:MAG: hypothetical protein FD155_2366 [Bacteroidota bacterium]
MNYLFTISKITSFVFMISFLAVGLKAQNIEELNATEIVKTAVNKTLGKTVSTTLTMNVVRPGWTKEIRLKIWTDEYVKALILITYPAKEKGQTYLRRHDDLWNWLPNIQKTIKLSSTLMSQSWMGSDFTNEDLLNKSSFLNDYQHSIISFENIDDKRCFKLLLTPKTDAAVVWEMVYLWISVEGFDQLKAEFFGENMQLIRTMTAYDIKNFGAVSIPARIVMEPAAKPNHKTIITVNEFQNNLPIDDAFFTMQNMKNLK